MTECAYTVRMSAGAQREALRAADYIAEQGSSDGADRWYEGLRAALRTLVSFPARCRVAPERRTKRGDVLRQLLYGSYRVVFIMRGRTVYVLHVRHAARRPIEGHGSNALDG